MQLAIGYVLLVAALVIIAVALLRLRRSAYQSEADKSVQPILLAGSACSLVAAIVLLTS